MKAVKINPTYARFFSESKEIINGRVVKDITVNSEYDGKNLHVDKRDNNKVSHFLINNRKKRRRHPKKRKTRRRRN